MSREVHIHFHTRDAESDWVARREGDEWVVQEKKGQKRNIRLDAKEAESNAEAVKVGMKKLGVR